MWVYLGDAAHPYNVFDFTVNRKRGGPQRFRMSRLGAPSILISLGSRAGARLRWTGVRAQPVRRAFCLIMHTGHA
jgi:hypothetical protein